MVLVIRRRRWEEGKGWGSGPSRCVPLPSRGNTGVWNQCAVKCSLAAGYSFQHYPCTNESRPCLCAAYAVYGYQQEALLRLRFFSPPCSPPTLNGLLQTVVALLTWDSSHTRVSLKQTCEHYIHTVVNLPSNPTSTVGEPVQKKAMN